MAAFRFGVIGCGRIAERHVEVIKSIESCELVSVCDVVEERARQFGSLYNVNWYDSAGEMLEKERLDVVNVLTPSGNHAKMVLDIAAKVANIVVEKPMALRLDDADRMIAACEKYKTRLFVVKQNRYNVPVIKLREAMDQGRFGRLALGAVRVRWTRTQAYYNQDKWRGTWAMDGGVLANQASHHIDLLV
ncbi:MAG: Gfo/Idh/MocA family protein, partial [Candidatus Sifarchaeia archaeon]